MDSFQRRLKPCVRCGLEHLGRDFPSYSEIRKGKKINRICWWVKHTWVTSIKDFHLKLTEYISNSSDGCFVHSVFILLRAAQKQRASVTLASEIQTAYQPQQKMSLKANRLAGVNLVTHALNFVTASSLRRVDKMFFWMSDERAS